MKPFLIVLVLGVCAVARAIDPDDLIFGVDGAIGVTGPQGTTGEDGASPPGLGLNCGANGVALNRDGAGLAFQCVSGDAHHLELLGSNDGSVGSSISTAPLDAAPSTVVVTAAANATAVYAENVTGTALRAAGRIDLNVGAVGKVRLPLLPVADFCDADPPFPSSCMAVAECPTGYRVVGGGCDNSRTDLVASYCFARGFNCLSQTQVNNGVVPTQILCGNSASSGATPRVTAYATCLAETVP